MKKNNLPKPSFKEEKLLWNKGYEFVLGIDEVGRGAFAGPLVVAIVAFRKNYNTNPPFFSDINDSKLLKPSMRSELSPLIVSECLVFSIGVASVSTINKIGVGKATTVAIRKALKKIDHTLSGKKRFVLMDGFYIKHLHGIGLTNQKAIIKGDRKSISIAAASIVAKVYRDTLMEKLGKKYKNYSFSRHKGYGTKSHQKEIKSFGLSKIHRTSFRLSCMKSVI